MKHFSIALVTAALAIPVVVGVASAGCMHTAEPVSRTGRVEAVRGLTGVAVGQTCSIDVAAEARASLNCRVTVRCGERTLFGGANPGGYAACGVTGGRYGSAADPLRSARDGDPALELDLERRVARVTDAGYEVRIALAE